LVSKYKKEPIRCLKCQGWNHVASECIRKTDLCSTCGEDGHRTSACETVGRQHCTSCNSDDHPSWVRHCPTFVRKCGEFNQKHPENSLPFYPSQEQWMWAPDPPKPDQWGHRPVAKQVPIQQRAGAQRLHQQQLRFKKTSAQGNRTNSDDGLHWTRRMQETLPADEPPLPTSPINDRELYGTQGSSVFASNTISPSLYSPHDFRT